MSMYFYVNSNAQPNGDHEVHRSDCSWLPSAENRVYLGCFSTSREAVNAARKYYRQVDGCCFCCPESHHSLRQEWPAPYTGGPFFARREMLRYDDADLGTCKSPGRSGTEQEGN